MLLQQLLATALVLAFPTPDDQATITGTVRNASRGNTPVARADVVLQIQQDASFIPLSETSTDDRGRFAFHNVPLAGDPLYLVGAIRDGVFHPGERVRPDVHHPEADVTVPVFDAITDPSPLIARRHEIVIRTEPNLLNISETIWISNPSSHCYVGRDDNSRNVTLRLHIPSNFEKVTFHKEFYGRRFTMIDGALMTSVPWPPGDRELAFTYILPIEKKQQVWARPLDLPCSDVRVSVVSPNSNPITSNLGRIHTDTFYTVSFGSDGQLLPAGHVVRVELGRLPIPFSAYARWIALGLLTAFMVMAALVVLIRRVSGNRAVGANAARIAKQSAPLRRAGQQFPRVAKARVNQR